jgi:hypothetical protein
MHRQRTRAVRGPASAQPSTQGWTLDAMLMPHCRSQWAKPGSAACVAA